MSEVYNRYIFDFLRNYQVVFKVVLPLCISSSNVCKFELYLHQLGLVSLFNFNHFRNCVMKSQCGLNCIFLIANNDEHLLMCLFASCISFFACEKTVQIFAYVIFKPLLFSFKCFLCFSWAQ